VTQAQLGSAQARSANRKASLQQARINLEHTRITAPVDGTVIARRMDVGQTVAASFAAPTIFEIAQDLTKMQLDTNVDESDIGNISASQKSDIHGRRVSRHNFPRASGGCPQGAHQRPKRGDLRRGDFRGEP